MITTYQELLDEITQHIEDGLITEEEGQTKRNLIELRIARETRDREIGNEQK